MTTYYLPPDAYAAKSPVRVAALMLILALAAGCSNSSREPVVTPNEIATTSVQAEETDSTDAIATTKAQPPVANGTASPKQVSQESPLIDGQEPGYIGYPIMGETATGEVVRYISSQPLDCTGTDAESGCSQSVLVTFIQTNPSDPYTVLDGQAVANCDLNVLTEVIIDNDLVSYELSSPDEAMTQLLTFTCEEAVNTELIHEAPASAQFAEFTEGMPYGEVRSQLIAEGWTPKPVQMSHYTTLEQSMYDQGYTEVLGCSGTGLCRFEFDAEALSNDQALVVITSFAESAIYYEDEPLLRSINTDASAADDLSVSK